MFHHFQLVRCFGQKVGVFKTKSVIMEYRESDLGCGLEIDLRFWENQSNENSARGKRRLWVENT